MYDGISIIHKGNNATIPNFSKIIEGKVYDTQKATLLGYYTTQYLNDDYGTLGGKGIYFHGYFKTKNDRYFEYTYHNTYKKWSLFYHCFNNEKDIYERSKDYIAHIVPQCPHSFYKAEDLFELVEA